MVPRELERQEEPSAPCAQPDQAEIARAGARRTEDHRERVAVEIMKLAKVVTMNWSGDARARSEVCKSANTRDSVSAVAWVDRQTTS